MQLKSLISAKQKKSISTNSLRHKSGTRSYVIKSTNEEIAFARQISDGLLKNAKGFLKSTLPGELLSIDKTDYNYAILIPDTGVNNEKGLNFVTNAVKKDPSGQLKVNGSYLNVYKEGIVACNYALSKADAKLVKDANAKAKNETQTLITAYQSITGEKVPLGDGRVQKVLDGIVGWGEDVKLQDLKSARSQKDLERLLPNAPPSADLQVLANALTSYLNAVESALGIEDSRQTAMAFRGDIINALERPSPATLGIPVEVNENVDSMSRAEKDRFIEGIRYFPGVKVTPREAGDIEQDLANTNNKVEVTVTVTKRDSSKFECHVSGGVGITIPMVSWLVGDIGSKGSYDYSKDVEKSSTVTIKLTYPGICAVSDVTFESYNSSSRTGWYNPSLIRDSQKYVKDTTGWHFQGSKTVEQNIKENGYLKALVLSQKPSIDITYQGKNAEKIMKKWQTQASTGFTLFGFIRIGGSESTSKQDSTFVGTSEGFTVSIHPEPYDAKEDTTIRSAHVLGAVAEFPFQN